MRQTPSATLHLWTDDAASLTGLGDAFHEEHDTSTDLGEAIIDAYGFAHRPAGFNRVAVVHTTEERGNDGTSFVFSLRRDAREILPLADPVEAARVRTLVERRDRAIRRLTGAHPVVLLVSYVDETAGDGPEEGDHANTDREILARFGLTLETARQLFSAEQR